MTDLNIESKKRFDLFYKAVKSIAKINGTLFLESLELSNLSPEESLLKLCQEDNLLKYDIDGYKRKDYFIFADNESRIYNIYYGHQLIDHIDEKQEEQQVLESLILHEKRQILHQLIEQSKIKLPLFTYSDFLNGEMNVVFYELNQKPPTTSHEDYLLMRSWQRERKLKYVNLGFWKLRERLIETINDSDSVTFHLLSEKQQVNDLIRNAHRLPTRQFVANMYRLRGLEPNCLPQNKREFHELFCKFIKGKNFSHALNPPAFRQADENFRSGKIAPIPLFCWSLIKYQRWLTTVLEGKIELMEPPYCDYELLFEQTFESALVKSQKFIAEFRSNYPFGTVAQKHYKSIVLDKLKQLREEFNHLDLPDYYQLLLSKEKVRNYFINHTFLDVDIENHCCQMRKAIVLNEKIKFLKHELFKIDEKLIKPSLDIAEMKNHFADIISVMIPNAEINEQLWRAFNQTLLAVVGRKPGYFIEEDFKVTARYIFKQALLDLNQCLDRLPIHMIEAYVANQLDKLELLALTSHVFSKELFEYINELKRLLEIKLKCHPLQQINPLLNTERPLKEMVMRVIRPENNKSLAFNYNEIKDDKLALVLRMLIKLKAIPLTTTLPQFRALFNGHEVIHPIEWWATQGDLMTFIKEMIRINEPEFTSYKQHWKIAVKCFMKKGGIELFDHNKLRLSKPTSREQKFMEAARKFI